MLDFDKPRPPVINAMLAPKAEYVRVADWQGKSLTFVLADEVLVKQKPKLLGRRKKRKEKRGVKILNVFRFLPS